MKPKLLKKITNGRVFAYTEELAKRSDMVAVWPDGVDPNVNLVRATGLRAEESQVGQIRSEMADKDKQIVSLQKQLEDLVNENMKLNEEIAKLNELIKNTSVDQGRMETIAQAIKRIKEENERNNFTSQGKIRLEPLESICGFTITAAERDAAMEMK